MTTDISLPKKSRVPVVLGVIVTIFWIAACTVLICWKRDSLAGMKLNEFGDFAAGAFAPLAFLWLVLGYLQQGEDLRLNREALLLQAKELANSVQQQEALVDASRQQVDAAREALEMDARQRRIEALPMFEIRPAGHGRTDNQFQYTLSISNVGATVAGVSVEYASPSGVMLLLASFQIFQSEKTVTPVINLYERLEIGSKIFVGFETKLQEQREIPFEIRAGATNTTDIISFVRL
jgi:hypothetical protein